MATGFVSQTSDKLPTSKTTATEFTLAADETAVEKTEPPSLLDKALDSPGKTIGGVFDAAVTLGADAIGLNKPSIQPGDVFDPNAEFLTDGDAIKDFKNWANEETGLSRLEVARRIEEPEIQKQLPMDMIKRYRVVAAELAAIEGRIRKNAEPPGFFDKVSEAYKSKQTVSEGLIAAQEITREAQESATLGLAKGVAQAGVDMPTAIAQLAFEVGKAGTASFKAVTGEIMDNVTAVARGEIGHIGEGVFRWSERYREEAWQQNIAIAIASRDSGVGDFLDEVKTKIDEFLKPHDSIQEAWKYGFERLGVITIAGMPINAFMKYKRRKWLDRLKLDEKGVPLNPAFYDRIKNYNKNIQRIGKGKGKLETVFQNLGRRYIAKETGTSLALINKYNAMANVGATGGSIIIDNMNEAIRERNKYLPEKDKEELYGTGASAIGELLGAVLIPWKIAVGGAITAKLYKAIRLKLKGAPPGSIDSLLQGEARKAFDMLAKDIASDAMSDIERAFLADSLDRWFALTHKLAKGDPVLQEQIMGAMSIAIEAPILMSIAEKSAKGYRMGFSLHGAVSGKNSSAESILKAQIEAVRGLRKIFKDMDDHIVTSGLSKNESLEILRTVLRKQVDEWEDNITASQASRIQDIQDDAEFFRAQLNGEWLTGNTSRKLSSSQAKIIEELQMGEKYTADQLALLKREFATTTMDSAEFATRQLDIMKAARKKWARSAGKFWEDNKNVVFKDQNKMMHEFLEDIDNIAKGEGMDPPLWSVSQQNQGKPGYSVRKFISNKYKSAVDSIPVHPKKGYKGPVMDDVYDLINKRGLGHKDKLSRKDFMDAGADIKQIDRDVKRILKENPDLIRELEVNISLKFGDFQTMRTAMGRMINQSDPAKKMILYKQTDRMDEFIKDYSTATKSFLSDDMRLAQIQWKLYSDVFGGRGVGWKSLQVKPSGARVIPQDMMFDVFIHPDRIGLTMKESHRQYLDLFGDNIRARELLLDAFKRSQKKIVGEGKDMTLQQARNMTKEEGFLDVFGETLGANSTNALRRAEDASTTAAGVAKHRAAVNADIKKTIEQSTAAIRTEIARTRTEYGRTPAAILVEMAEGQPGVSSLEKGLLKALSPAEGGDPRVVKALIEGAEDPEKMEVLLREIMWASQTEKAMFPDPNTTIISGQLRPLQEELLSAAQFDIVIRKNEKFWIESRLYTEETVEQMKDLSAVLTVMSKHPERLGLSNFPGGMSIEGMLSRGYAISRGVISPRFAMSELSIRYWRFRRGRFLQAIASDPNLFSALHTLVVKGSIPSKAVQRRFKGVLTGLAIRDGVDQEELAAMNERIEKEIAKGTFMLRTDQIADLQDKQIEEERMRTPFIQEQPPVPLGPLTLGG